MQKVVGSNPISRFDKTPANTGVLLLRGPAKSVPKTVSQNPRVSGPATTVDT